MDDQQESSAWVDALTETELKVELATRGLEIEVKTVLSARLLAAIQGGCWARLPAEVAMQIVGCVAAARDHASVQSLLCTSNELRRMASEFIHAAVMTEGPGGLLALFPRMAVASKLRVKGMAAGAVATALLAASSSSPNRLLAINDFNFEAAAGDLTPLDATLPTALAAACPRLERLAVVVGAAPADTFLTALGQLGRGGAGAAAGGGGLKSFELRRKEYFAPPLGGVRLNVAEYANLTTLTRLSLRGWEFNPEETRLLIRMPLLQELEVAKITADVDIVGPCAWRRLWLQRLPDPDVVLHLRGPLSNVTLTCELEHNYYERWQAIGKSLAARDVV